MGTDIFEHQLLLGITDILQGKKQNGDQRESDLVFLTFTTHTLWTYL